MVAMNKNALKAKKDMTSSLLEALNEMALAERDTRLDQRLEMFDSDLQMLIEAMQSNTDQELESLRRDLFALRNQGRQLKKIIQTTKKKFRKMGTLIFDSDIDVKELKPEINRLSAITQEAINANLRFNAAYDAFQRKLKRLRKKTSANSAEMKRPMSG